jgi:hypothetical protein
LSAGQPGKRGYANLSTGIVAVGMLGLGEKRVRTFFGKTLARA